jgi:hypothetical protein
LLALGQKKTPNVQRRMSNSDNEESGLATDLSIKHWAFGVGRSAFSQ